MTAWLRAAGVVLLLLPRVASSLEGVDSVRTFNATAFDQTSGELLFCEEHRDGYGRGRRIWSQITYRDPAGEVIAEKFLGFAGSATAPEMHLADRRDGYREGVSVQDGSLVLFRSSDSSGGPPERRVLPLAERTVVDLSLIHI